jgi:hypothetical protein
MEDAMKLLWHYTVDHNVGGIFRCGYVDVARILVVPPEKPVAWFSADQYWERTVVKAFPNGSMQGMLRAGISLYRIGVLPEAAPLNWTAIRKLSGMTASTAKLLLRNAKELGANPWHWYGSFSPVLESQWQVVETFKDGWTEVAVTEIENLRAPADDQGSGAEPLDNAHACVKL